jgi:hypothetical protein
MQEEGRKRFGDAVKMVHPEISSAEAAALVALNA